MQSLYQTVSINMAICCSIGVVCTKSETERGCLRSDYLKPPVADNLCRKRTWNRTKRLHNNSVFETILYSNYFKPTVPCTGGRTTSQNPTSDVLLRVRTGRRVLSKDERAAFISSNILKLSWTFHSVFAPRQPYYYLLTHSSSSMWLYPRMTTNHGAALWYIKVKGVDPGQTEAHLTSLPSTCMLLGRFKDDERVDGEWGSDASFHHWHWRVSAGIGKLLQPLNASFSVL